MRCGCSHLLHLSAICGNEKMAASSFSVAAAALPTSSHSLSASPVDQFSLNFFPCKLIRTSSKLMVVLNFSLSSSSSPFCSSLHCGSTAFDDVELDQEEVEEDEPSNGAPPSKSEVAEENGAPQIADAGRLYVENLPFTMTSAQLTEIFTKAGRVISAKVVYDRVTDRSRDLHLLLWVVLKKPRKQSDCLMELVNFPEVPQGGEREVMNPKIRSSYQGYVDSPYKIYAGNLSWSLTPQALRDAFSQLPGYLSAKVIYDRDSGRSRGFGFITFSSAENVESALAAMDGLELEGRPLRLNPAEQRAAAPPSSTRS